MSYKIYSKSNYILGKSYLSNTFFGGTNQVGKAIHISTNLRFTQAVALKLPTNVVDINAAEMGRFSPLRERDISGPVINSCYKKLDLPQIDITSQPDPHVNKYDCRGAVNLSSSMQSNVPSPFSGDHTHLNMPGSQWGQGNKYLSDHLHSAHYLTLRNEYRDKALNSENTVTEWSFPAETALKFTALSQCFVKNNLGTFIFTNRGSIKYLVLIRLWIESRVVMLLFLFQSIAVTLARRNMSTTATSPMSAKEKLKNAVKEYGSTVIIFHVTISLFSLGGFYLLVSSGVDIVAIMHKINIGEGTVSKLATSNAGSFVIAYAVHKVFAPVRMAITLTATPFIVKYLRSIGIIKRKVNSGGGNGK